MTVMGREQYIVRLFNQLDGEAAFENSRDVDMVIVSPNKPNLD